MGLFTKNFGLYLPALDEFYDLVNHWNYNMQIIDNALSSSLTITDMQFSNYDGFYPKNVDYYNGSTLCMSSMLTKEDGESRYTKCIVKMYNKDGTISSSGDIKFTYSDGRVSGIISNIGSLSVVGQACIVYAHNIHIGISNTFAGVDIADSGVGSNILWTSEKIKKYCDDTYLKLTDLNNITVGNSDRINGVKFYPRVGLSNPSTVYVYAFNGGDDENCYVYPVSSLNVGNADTLDNKHASAFALANHGHSNYMPLQSAGSVAEMGQYINFHKSGTSVDYSCRIYCGSNSEFRVTSNGYDYDINTEITNLKITSINGLRNLASTINGVAGTSLTETSGYDAMCNEIRNNLGKKLSMSSFRRVSFNAGDYHSGTIFILNTSPSETFGSSFQFNVDEQYKGVGFTVYKQFTGNINTGYQVYRDTAKSSGYNIISSDVQYDPNGGYNSFSNNIYIICFDRSVRMHINSQMQMKYYATIID